jgi:hypothetical protein
VARYGAIVMAEQPVAADPIERARLLAAAWRERPLDEPSQQLLRRARFAGVAVDLVALSETAAASARSIHDLDIRRVPAVGDVTRTGRHRANVTDRCQAAGPRGSTIVRTGRCCAAVKLQELFGLAETPRLGPRQQPW